jgi:O-antigen/teichoic acid export membrane protein
MRKSTRIIANTVASYARLCFSAASGFVTVPIALHALGAADYGLFAVIAGSLSFLMFINGALTTGAQRHIAYSIGQGDAKEANRWFTLSVCVHSFLGALVLIAGWSSSGLVLHHLLQIPSVRSKDALWIYHLVVFAMVCDVVSTPYQAFLMAREAIVVLSAFGVAGSLLLVSGTISLKLLPGDALWWYSTIYVLSQVTILMGPMCFCLARFAECRRLSWRGVQKGGVIELLSFSGWNLFGGLSGPVRMQGPALLLNHFVGPIANASYGIALQVNGFTANLSSGLMRATSPVIVKSEAAGDRKGMILLSNLSSKGAFLILWLAIGPVLMDMHFLLKLWLKTEPNNTGYFASMLLCALLIDQLTSGFVASMQAHGKIALYQIVVGSITCMSFPIGYLLMAHGMPPVSILYAVVFVAVAAGAARVILTSRVFDLSAKEWASSVLVPCLLVVVVSSLAMNLMSSVFQPGAVRLASLTATNLVVVAITLWSFGIRRREREKIKERFHEIWVSRKARRVLVTSP